MYVTLQQPCIVGIALTLSSKSSARSLTDRMSVLRGACGDLYYIYATGLHNATHTCHLSQNIRKPPGLTEEPKKSPWHLDTHLENQRQMHTINWLIVHIWHFQ